MRLTAKITFLVLTFFVGLSLVPQSTYARNERTHVVYEAKARTQRVEKRVHTQHLDFVAAKLDAAVEEGALTHTQKRNVLEAVRELMKSQPTSADFVDMSSAKQKQVINRWKERAAKEIKDTGVTLEELRELTGKGNKYLMGIEF